MSSRSRWRRRLTRAPTVIALVRVRIRGRGSGVEVIARGPHSWTLEDRKVVRFVLYQEKEEALEAVGPSE
jgi:hypothetical protein